MYEVLVYVVVIFFTLFLSFLSDDERDCKDCREKILQIFTTLRLVESIFANSKMVEGEEIGVWPRKR